MLFFIAFIISVPISSVRLFRFLVNPSDKFSSTSSKKASINYQIVDEASHLAWEKEWINNNGTKEKSNDYIYIIPNGNGSFKWFTRDLGRIQ